MNTTHDFGELRSLLERRPSAAAFDLVIQHLDAAAEEDLGRTRAEWLPHVEGRLERWPDATRLCPKHRLEEYEAGERVWCELVRAANYEGVSLSKKRMQALLDGPAFPKLTALDLRSANLKWDQLATLASEAPCRLRAFGFRRVSKLDMDTIDALFASEMLSTVESLTFRGWDKIKPDVYTHLAEHFPLEQLRELDLTGGAVTSRSFKALLETDAVDGLEVLRAGAWVSDKSSPGLLALIAKRPAMRSLRVLHLNEVKPKEFAALADAEHLTSLRELRVDYTLEIAGTLALLECPHLAGVEDLRLNMKREDRDVFMRALAVSPILEGLHSLHLSWYGEEPVGEERGEPLVALLSADAASSLRRLSICADSSGALNALVACSGDLSGLRELMLTSVDGMPQRVVESAASLFSGDHFPELETFTLGSNSLMHALMKELCGSELLVRLESFRPIECGEEDLVGLLGEEPLPNLKTLDLRGLTGWSHRGLIPALAGLDTLTGLESLIMNEGYLVEQVQAVLAEGAHALPDRLAVSCPEYAMFQAFDWF